MSTNEDLEKKLTASKDLQTTQSSPETSHLEDEIRRLQAQNAALQKNVACRYMGALCITILPISTQMTYTSCK